MEVKIKHSAESMVISVRPCMWDEDDLIIQQGDDMVYVSGRSLMEFLNAVKAVIGDITGEEV